MVSTIGGTVAAGWPPPAGDGGSPGVSRPPAILVRSAQQPAAPPRTFWQTEPTRTRGRATPRFPCRRKTTATRGRCLVGPLYSQSLMRSSFVSSLGGFYVRGARQPGRPRRPRRVSAVGGCVGGLVVSARRLFPALCFGLDCVDNGQVNTLGPKVLTATRPAENRRREALGRIVAGGLKLVGGLVA